MQQPEGLQSELAKLSRAARKYVLESGVQLVEQQAEIERLRAALELSEEYNQQKDHQLARLRARIENSVTCLTGDDGRGGE